MSATLYFGDVESDTPYRDSAGRALSGAVLTFWCSGTSEPAPVYNGATMSQEHSPPITANAQGVFPPIYLDPAITYRVRLEDVHGRLVWDVDPYLKPASGEIEDHVDVFTESGTFVVPDGVTEVDVLVVAGGGSGSNSLTGGGGGAGGVILEEGFEVTPAAEIPVVVGAGGIAGPGEDSSFGDLVAAGGGAGGGANPNGGDGGSGGGGNGDASGLGGSGTAGQGHDGGRGADGTISQESGGGGGGAGEPGADGVRGGPAGDGGDGVDVSAIFGTGIGDDGWVGGGGGGGKAGPGAPVGFGGRGGGTGRGNQGSAMPNTGGGAAGGTHLWEGGSGVVAVRYGGAAPGVLFLSPVQQPTVDSRVQPGAELKFFASDQIADVYADGVLTIPLAHPVGADAGGSFPPIYIDDEIEYETQLKNAAGVVLDGPADQPLPTIESIDPAAVDEGDPQFTLTVAGSGFTEDSVVRLNGSDRATAYVSAAELQATILVGDVASPGVGVVRVFNPVPLGGLSNAKGLTVVAVPDNPEPVLTLIDPDSAEEGGASFTLTCTGTGFIPDSVVRWDGSDRPTTYVSGTELQADIDADDIASADSVDVTVFNPAPGGGESNALTFEVEEAVPTDPHFANVVALLHFEGADASTTFTDVIGKTWTPTGNAQIDTAQFKFGAASGLFDGSGDYIQAASHADFAFGTGDFTIEFFCRPTNTSAGLRLLLDMRPSGNNVNPYPVIYQSGSGLFFFHSNANRITGTGALTGATWQHIAVSRVSGTTRMFVDGTQVGSDYTDSTSYLQGAVRIAESQFSPGTAFPGHIDELRITKGVGRYSSNFTAPSAQFPDS